MMRSHKSILPTSTVALALALLVSACGGDHAPRHDAAETQVIRATLDRAELLEVPRRIELVGVVTAERTAAVSARVMAMVTAVRVRAGDEVTRGQLLLEIDPQAARGQLAQAQGALGQARAALALAERNHQRFQALAATNSASELELDMARMQHEQAQAAVEQAEGAVAAASAVASDSRVVAPFAGWVVQRLVEVGDLAAPGRPLIMIESRGDRRIALSVPESLAAQAGLGVGSRLEARVDSRPDLGSLDGTVVEMTPGADPASHSFRVEIALPVADLPSGTAARAWLTLDRRAAVTIPRSAVVRQGGMTLAVVRAEDGLAASRVVTLGEELADDRVEVLSGLAGGETVLTGLRALPPAGTRVEEVGQ